MRKQTQFPNHECQVELDDAELQSESIMLNFCTVSASLSIVATTSKIEKRKWPSLKEEYDVSFAACLNWEADL